MSATAIKSQRSPKAPLRVRSAAAVVVAAAAVSYAAAAVAAAAEEDKKDKYDPKTGVASKAIVTAHKKLHSAAVHRLILLF